MVDQIILWIPSFLQHLFMLLISIPLSFLWVSVVDNHGKNVTVARCLEYSLWLIFFGTLVIFLLLLWYQYHSQ
jgi:hypothetical protein